MPYIHVRVAGELDRQQKEEIARQFSETLEEVTGKPKSYTYIVIEQVERENWAVGGNLLG